MAKTLIYNGKCFYDGRFIKAITINSKSPTTSCTNTNLILFSRSESIKFIFLYAICSDHIEKYLEEKYSFFGPNGSKTEKFISKGEFDMIRVLYG